jgi:hypothetical protein
MESVGTRSPLFSRRNCRARGVYMELLVKSRNLAPRSSSLSTKSAAPGIGAAPRIKTPSMSIK